MQPIPLPNKYRKTRAKRHVFRVLHSNNTQRDPWQGCPATDGPRSPPWRKQLTKSPKGRVSYWHLAASIFPFLQSAEDVFFLVRMIDQPDCAAGNLPNHKLVLGKPAAEPKSEEALLLAEQISHIVCRNSGGEGAYAKIIAARNLQLPVIMITG